eukprot:jgi/Mesen1/4358/ME000022S03652
MQKVRAEVGGGIQDGSVPLTGGQAEAEEKESGVGEVKAGWPGLFDLNASPTGFDLNAPLKEPEIGPSSWVRTKNSASEPSVPKREEVDSLLPASEGIASTRSEADAGNPKKKAKLGNDSTLAVEKKEFQDDASHAHKQQEQKDPSLPQKVSHAKQDGDQEVSASAAEVAAAQALPPAHDSGDGALPEVAADVVASFSLEHLMRPNCSGSQLQRISAEPLQSAQPSKLGFDEELEVIWAVWAAQASHQLDVADRILVQALEVCAAQGGHGGSPATWRYHSLSCMYLSKKLPHLFGLPHTSRVLMDFLRPEEKAPAGAKRASPPVMAVLAARLLFRAYSHQPLDWPLDLVQRSESLADSGQMWGRQVYLEDAAGPRAWVDNASCRELCANILTAFPDVEEQQQQEERLGADPAGPPAGHQVEASGETATPSSSSAAAAAGGVQAAPGSEQGREVRRRYESGASREGARAAFLSVLNSALTPAAKDNPRILLKLLMLGVGFEEVRALASSLLQPWLNSALHVRPARALLDRIVTLTRANTEQEYHTVANLVKGPTGAGMLGDLVCQLARRCPEYAAIALKTFLVAELQRPNAHNLKGLATAMRAMQPPALAQEQLALILQEMAAADDTRPHLRGLVRRVVRACAGDTLSARALCTGLMQPWPAMAQQHPHLKDAWLSELAELVALLMTLAATAAAPEEAVAAVGPIGPAVAAVAPPAAAGGVSLGAPVAVTAAAGAGGAGGGGGGAGGAVSAPRLRNLSDIVAVQAQPVGSAREAGGGEEAASVQHQLAACGVPVLEDTLARVILMGITRYPLRPDDALGILERLVLRAATIDQHGQYEGAVAASNPQLPTAVLTLSAFQVPPDVHVAPNLLTVAPLYWQASSVLLVMGAFNCPTLGLQLWDRMPTMRSLMEAVMTQSYRTSARESAALPGASRPGVATDIEQYRLRSEKDAHAVAALREAVARAEAHMLLEMAAENASRGLPAPSKVPALVDWEALPEQHLLVLDPEGPCREPPLATWHRLEQLDREYGLGHKIRRSRNPDFLGQLTASQTLEEAWAWLCPLLSEDPPVTEILFRLSSAAVHLDSTHPPVDMGLLLASLHRTVTGGGGSAAEEEPPPGQTPLQDAQPPHASAAAGPDEEKPQPGWKERQGSTGDLGSRAAVRAERGAESQVQGAPAVQVHDAQLVVAHLAARLGASRAATRSRAERCLASIFAPPPAAAAAASVPPARLEGQGSHLGLATSPREHHAPAKAAPFAVPGGAAAAAATSHAAAAAAATPGTGKEAKEPGPPKRQPPGVAKHASGTLGSHPAAAAAAGSHGASASLPAAVEAAGHQRGTITVKAESEEETGAVADPYADADAYAYDAHAPGAWLALGGLPTQQVLLRILVPAVLSALRRETFLPLVAAYLQFLVDNRAAAPSPGALPCGMASLVLRRKLLAASLFSSCRRCQLAPAPPTSSDTPDSAGGFPALQDSLGDCQLEPWGVQFGTPRRGKPSAANLQVSVEGAVTAILEVLREALAGNDGCVGSATGGGDGEGEGSRETGGVPEAVQLAEAGGGAPEPEEEPPLVLVWSVTGDGLTSLAGPREAGGKAGRGRGGKRKRPDRARGSSKGEGDQHDQEEGVAAGAPETATGGVPEEAAAGGSGTGRRSRVPRVVLAAAVEALSLAAGCSSPAAVATQPEPEEGTGMPWRPPYERLVSMLYPALMAPGGCAPDGDVLPQPLQQQVQQQARARAEGEEVRGTWSVERVEDVHGRPVQLLLSEAQAARLAAGRDPRLITLGVRQMPVARLLQLLLLPEEVGAEGSPLPVPNATAVLRHLDTLPSQLLAEAWKSVEEEEAAAGVTSSERALEGTVRALQQRGAEGGEQLLRRLHAFISSGEAEATPALSQAEGDEGAAQKEHRLDADGDVAMADGGHGGRDVGDTAAAPDGEPPPAMAASSPVLLSLSTSGGRVRVREEASIRAVVRWLLLPSSRASLPTLDTGGSHLSPAAGSEKADVSLAAAGAAAGQQQQHQEEERERVLDDYGLMMQHMAHAGASSSSSASSPTLPFLEACVDELASAIRSLLHEAGVLSSPPPGLRHLLLLLPFLRQLAGMLVHCGPPTRTGGSAPRAQPGGEGAVPKGAPICDNGGPRRRALTHVASTFSSAVQGLLSACGPPAAVEQPEQEHRARDAAEAEGQPGSADRGNRARILLPAQAAELLLQLAVDVAAEFPGRAGQEDGDIPLGVHVGAGYTERAAGAAAEKPGASQQLSRLRAVEALALSSSSSSSLAGEAHTAQELATLVAQAADSSHSELQPLVSTFMRAACQPALHDHRLHGRGGGGSGGEGGGGAQDAHELRHGQGTAAALHGERRMGVLGAARCLAAALSSNHLAAEAMETVCPVVVDAMLQLDCEVQLEELRRALTPALTLFALRLRASNSRAAGTGRWKRRDSSALAPTALAPLLPACTPVAPPVAVAAAVFRHVIHRASPRSREELVRYILARCMHLEEGQESPLKDSAAEECGGRRGGKEEGALGAAGGGGGGGGGGGSLSSGFLKRVEEEADAALAFVDACLLPAHHLRGEPLAVSASPGAGVTLDGDEAAAVAHLAALGLAASELLGAEGQGGGSTRVQRASAVHFHIVRKLAACRPGSLVAMTRHLAKLAWAQAATPVLQQASPVAAREQQALGNAGKALLWALYCWRPVQTRNTLLRLARSAPEASAPHLTSPRSLWRLAEASPLGPRLQGLLHNLVGPHEAHSVAALVPVLRLHTYLAQNRNEHVGSIRGGNAARRRCAAHALSAALTLLQALRPHLLPPPGPPKRAVHRAPEGDAAAADARVQLEGELEHENKVGRGGEGQPHQYPTQEEQEQEQEQEVQEQQEGEEREHVRGQLEAVLEVYYGFLGALEASDKSLFSKTASQLAEFLSHCMAGGGRVAASVRAHRGVIEQAASALKQHKKLLGFLPLLGDQHLLPQRAEAGGAQVAAQHSPEEKDGTPAAAEVAAAVSAGATARGAAVVETGAAAVAAAATALPRVPTEQVMQVRDKLLAYVEEERPWRHLQLRQQPLQWPGGKWTARSQVAAAVQEEEEQEEEGGEAGVQAVLADVERASAKVPGLLPPLQGALLQLVGVRDARVRDSAHKLLRRLLLHHYSEEQAREVGALLVDQLEGDDTCLFKSAAKHSLAIFHHCPEHQEAMLAALPCRGSLVAEELHQLIKNLVLHS